MGQAGRGVVTVSPSQLDAMGCRLRWFWGYKQGYRAAKSSLALELGRGVHEALDQFYSEGKTPAKVFADWMDKRIKQMKLKWDDDKKEMDDLRKLGIGMLEGYVKEYPDDLERYEVLATEQTLKRKLPNIETGGLAKCVMVARLDGLVRDRYDGKLYSLEHKTYSRLNLGHLERDHQMTAQVWLGQFLAESMGIDEEVAGVIYNGLRKQLPSPRVKDKLFFRTYVYRTQRQVEVLLHRAYWQYRDMNRPNLPIFPQPDQVKCGMCDFQEPCIEYQRGGDYQFILDNLFSKRGKKGEAEAE